MKKIEETSDTQYLFAALFLIANKVDTLLGREFKKFDITTKQWFLSIVIDNLFDNQPTIKENEDFKSWFNEKTPTKAVGSFLMVIAVVFIFLWLSDSLPAVLTGTVPESIVKDNLTTNPVQALDFSFFLPLMITAAISLIKKKSLGYLLAPMMIILL